MDNNEKNVLNEDALQADQGTDTEKVTEQETAEEVASVQEATEEPAVEEAAVEEPVAQEPAPAPAPAPKPEKAAKPTATPVKTVKKPALSDAAKQRIKGLIFPVIMTAIILGIVLFILNHKNTTEEEAVIRVNKYEGTDEPIILENSDLKLTMDPMTTQFNIEVKSTGQIWTSVPEDGLNDPIAKSDAKGKVNSTLVITYTKDSGLEKEYNNYTYSIENGVYEIEATKDYIKINYSIGDVEKEYIIPPVTTAEKFEEYLSKLDKDTNYFVSQYYKKLDPNKPGKKDDVEALKAAYPVYAEGQTIYIIRDGANDALKSKLEEHFANLGYTMEDYKADCELDQSESSTDKAVFNVTVYYRLDGKDLVVELPYKDMQFSMNNPLFSITPLPMFGAGSTDDEGFLFVPEGGGAKINFNNGKLAQASYESKVYGRDMAIVKDSVVHDPVVNYNAYGIAKNGGSFLCIL